MLGVPRAPESQRPAALAAWLSLFLSLPAHAKAISFRFSTAQTLLWFVVPGALIAAMLSIVLFRLREPSLVRRLLALHAFCLLLFLLFCVIQPFVILMGPLLPWCLALVTFLVLVGVALRRRSGHQDRGVVR